MLYVNVVLFLVNIYLNILVFYILFDLCVKVIVNSKKFDFNLVSDKLWYNLENLVIKIVFSNLCIILFIVSKK